MGIACCHCSISRFAFWHDKHRHGGLSTGDYSFLCCQIRHTLWPQLSSQMAKPCKCHVDCRPQSYRSPSLGIHSLLQVKKNPSLADPFDASTPWDNADRFDSKEKGLWSDDGFDRFQTQRRASKSRPSALCRYVVFEGLSSYHNNHLLFHLGKLEEIKTCWWSPPLFPLFSCSSFSATFCRSAERKGLQW